MSSIISWKWDNSRKCYVFKKTDGRMMLIERKRRVLRLAEPILKDVLRAGVPVGNDYKPSRSLICDLKKRFEVVQDDIELDNKNVTAWKLFEHSKYVKIYWMNGDASYYTMDHVLTSIDVGVLAQLTKMSPDNDIKSAFLSQFVLDIKKRLDNIFQEEACSSNTVFEEEYDVELSDEDDNIGDGYYLSDDMSAEDYYG